jgi:hypothetical protein
LNEGAFDKVIGESLRNSSAAPGIVNESNGHMNAGMGQMTPNQRLKQMAAITAQAASGGNNKQAEILSKIFEDTAMTTLQQQLTDNGSGNAGMYVGEQSNPITEQRDKEQLEMLSNVGGGHGVKHWAALAFGTAGRK